jgi:hypothetical protein
VIRQTGSSESRKKESSMPTTYEIRIKGHLDAGWMEWLEGMAIIPLESGETLLSGPVADQAALYGLLNRIRDMNLTLVSVEKKCDNEAEDQGLPKEGFPLLNDNRISTFHSRLSNR